MKIYVIINYVLGFSYGIHRELGDMTESMLSLDILNKVQLVLGNTSLSDASIWSDTIKRKSGFTHTKKYHYVNINTCDISENTISKSCKEDNCVVYKILEFVNNFKTHDTSTWTQKENLMMIIHLIQDFFQPLHVYGIYAGGNRFKLIRNKNKRNRTTTLHKIYDNEIPSYFLDHNSDYYPKIRNLTFDNMVDVERSILEQTIDTVNTACSTGIYDRIHGSRYIIFEHYYDGKTVEYFFNGYFTMINAVMEFLFKPLPVSLNPLLMI